MKKKSDLSEKGNLKAKTTCSLEDGLVWGLAESWMDVIRILSLQVLLQAPAGPVLRQGFSSWWLTHSKPKSRIKEKVPFINSAQV